MLPAPGQDRVPEVRLYQVLLNKSDTLCNAVKRRPGAFVLFDKEILHPRLFFVLKDLFEIDRAIAHFGKSVSGGVIHILQMPEGKTTGMLVDQFYRVLTG